MKIGVFDSGVGGLSVAQSIQNAFPEREIVYKDDKEHVPYGTRHPDELFGFVVPIFEKLVAEGCGVIVIACNTVSTTLISRLRSKFSDITLVAVEPMVEQAAKISKTKVIAVCATPTTLASSRYAELKRLFAGNLSVLEPDCSEWAGMIERNMLDVRAIAESINAVLNQRADVVVLGCTHYHWIDEEIKVLVSGRASVLQPEPLIVAELRRILR